MSNTTTHEAKIVVTAQTDGAVTPLKEVAGATTEMTTAAKAAGAEQAELTKQLQQAKAKQIESQAALARVRQAQEQHNLTVRAFGPASAEAAASQTKLGRALNTAEKAAVNCKQEVEALKQGLAKASTESEKVSPVLAKVTKEVDKLNTSAAKSDDELRKLDLGMQAAAKSAQETARSLQAATSGSDRGGLSMDIMGLASKRLMSVLGPAALAGTAWKAAEALHAASGEVLAFETATSNIPFGLDRARKATHGLVTDMQLAKSAAQGVALGVVQSEAEFASLAEAATKLGIKLGIGPTQALDNMMTALGRGSTEMLDNLGIVLKVSDAQDRFAKSIGKTADELTDAQKQVAFKTEAIKALQQAAAETTVDLDSGAAAIQRMGVNAENAKMSLKALAVEGVGEVVRAGEQMSHALSDEHIAEQIAQVRAYSDEMFLLEKATRARSAAEQEYLRHIGKDVLDASKDELAIMEVIGRVAAENASTFGELDGELLHHYETVKDFTASLWNQADAYAQATKKARELAAAQKATDNDLWEKLQKRHDKAETDAIEDAFFAANEMGPALPPGFRQHDKKTTKKAKKHEFLDPGDVSIIRGHNGVAESDSLVLDAERRRDADQEAMVAREIERREENIKSIEREIEVREAAGEDVEDLAARRMAAEDELYEYTRQKSQDRQKVAEAETRHEKQQHDRRVAAAKAAAEKQAKWAELFQATIDETTSNVSDLTGTLIDAFSRQADGEKHAIAVSIEAYLAGLKVKMAAKAAEETVLGIAAMASYRYAEGVQHFTAAGLATAIALGSFAGQHAVRGAAEASTGKDWATIKDENSGSDGGIKDLPADGESTSKSGKSKKDGTSSRELEKMEVPISFEETRRRDASPSTSTRSHAGPVVHINVQGNIIGEGGKKELGLYLDKVLRDTRGSGKRP